jgi:DNA invertase Pin-like site-specific DNA recombinase
MQVIAYTRLSQEEADEKNGRKTAASFAVQRRVIEAECERRDGWPEPTVVREVISGGRPYTKRLKLHEAIGQLQRGDVLIVHRFDRLCRSTWDFADITRLAERKGWSLVVLDPPLDMTTPMGMANAQVLAVFAELERKMIGQRTREALAEKREQGIRLGAEPQIPERIARRVRRLRDRHGYTWQRIADSLNRDGEWHGTWYPQLVRKLYVRAPA